jgi:3-deoxy-D-manno-octulosonic-acid transferase
MPKRFLFIRLYSSVLELGRVAIFPIAKKMKKAPMWGLSERCELPPSKNHLDLKPTIWVHAASLGESKLMMKFLKLLRKKHPESLYVLTAATRTGVDYLNGCDSEDILAKGFFPLDTIGIMKKMITAFSISRVWLMETEIWPSMMFVCMQAGIPVGLANARMEEKSFEAYSRISFFCRPIFNYFDVVLAQNAAYAHRFSALGVALSKTHIVSNIKGLLDINPTSENRKKKLRDALKLNKGDIVVTAGCFHIGEGKIIKDVLEILQRKSLKIKCIIVPRHLGDTPTILKELGSNAEVFAEPIASTSWNLCIVNKMGILEDMYALCDIAVVGGTFMSVGGHNVWDAAQFALPVFFGPDYHTQRESCEQLLSAGVGFKADSAQDLAGGIVSVLKTDSQVFSAALTQLISGTNKRRQQIEELIP